MIKVTAPLLSLFCALSACAAGADYSWQPQEPAEWEQQQRDKTPAPAPSGASRWSAEEITRQQAQQAQIQQQNEQYLRQQQRDKDARNPACSQNAGLNDNNDERHRRDVMRYGPNGAPSRQMNTGCSSEALTFTLGE